MSESGWCFGGSRSGSRLLANVERFCVLPFPWKQVWARPRDLTIPFINQNLTGAALSVMNTGSGAEQSLALRWVPSCESAEQ